VVIPSSSRVIRDAGTPVDDTKASSSRERTSTEYTHVRSWAATSGRRSDSASQLIPAHENALR